MIRPRPIFATLRVPAHSQFAQLSLQCGRSIHTRGTATALTYHIWHDASRRRTENDSSMKRRNIQWTRNASTAAAAAATPKPSYGRMPPPPSKATKTSKTNLPAKKSASVHPSPPKTVPVKRPSTTTSTIPIVRAGEHLNPPLSTYAPHLDVPARKAGQNYFSYLYNCGKAYVTFYKTGISNVRQTSKLAKQLRQKAAQTKGKDITEVLTRAEWQVVLRSRKDILRLPAFGVLLLLFGEWLPLIVLYITPVIPEACRIPSQVQKQLSKREKMRHERLRRVSNSAMTLMARDRRPAGTTAPQITQSADPSHGAPALPMSEAIFHFKAEEMTLFELLLASARYDCHGRAFDLLGLTPPKWWLKRNVGKTLEYLKQDDKLIERDGGWMALGKAEVERACVERGIDVLGKKEAEMRRALVVEWKGGKI